MANIPTYSRARPLNQASAPPAEPTPPPSAVDLPPAGFGLPPVSPPVAKDPSLSSFASPGASSAPRFQEYQPLSQPLGAGLREDPSVPILPPLPSHILNPVLKQSATPLHTEFQKERELKMAKLMKKIDERKRSNKALKDENERQLMQLRRDMKAAGETNKQSIEHIMRTFDADVADRKRTHEAHMSELMRQVHEKRRQVHEMESFVAAHAPKPKQPRTTAPTPAPAQAKPKPAPVAAAPSPPRPAPTKQPEAPPPNLCIVCLEKDVTDGIIAFDSDKAVLTHIKNVHPAEFQSRGFADEARRLGITL